MCNIRDTNDGGGHGPGARACPQPPTQPTSRSVGPSKNQTNHTHLAT